MKNKRIKKFFLRFCSVVLIIVAIPFVLYWLFLILFGIALVTSDPTSEERLEYERRTGQIWQGFNPDGFKTCDRFPTKKRCVELCTLYPESERCLKLSLEGI